MDHIHYSQQSFVRDSLTVHTSHATIDMIHDGIDGQLVSALAVYSLKTVSERVEVESFPTVDAESLQE